MAHFRNSGAGAAIIVLVATGCDHLDTVTGALPKWQESPSGSSGYPGAAGMASAAGAPGVDGGAGSASVEPGAGGRAAGGESGIGGAGGAAGAESGGGGAGGAAGEASGGSSDAGSPGAAGAGGGPAITPNGATASQCLGGLVAKGWADYDQYMPTIGSHCQGTNQQDITGVERLVFVGDSITEGTPPTVITEFYRSRLADKLKQKFGAIEVADCAVWGAHVADLLTGGQQLAKCFPDAVEAKRTLTVMTMGGNDLAGFSKDKLTAATMQAKSDIVAQSLRDAVTWLKDPVRFPNGSFVVFANVYEYTDATGDLASCPQSSLFGLSGQWPDGIAGMPYLEQKYMQVAVDTKTDLAFLYEGFCGHGYHNGDTSSVCYRGPNTERLFDATCIHPTPNGHQHIADMFFDVIDE